MGHVQSAASVVAVNEAEAKHLDYQSRGLSSVEGLMAWPLNALVISAAMRLEAFLACRYRYPHIPEPAPAPEVCFDRNGSWNVAHTLPVPILSIIDFLPSAA